MELVIQAFEWIYKDQYSVLKYLVLTDTNDNYKRITKVTDDNKAYTDGYYKKITKVTEDNNKAYTNDNYRGATKVTKDNNKVLTTYKRLDKKVKPAPGVFPKDAWVI